MKMINKRIPGILISLTLSLVLTAVSFAMPETAYADDMETVTIGSGETQSGWLPHRTHFNNSRTQIIYGADDIGMDGDIVSLAYNVAVASPETRITMMKIWMGYTDLDRYEYNSDRGALLKAPDITPVFSGAVDLGTETGWYTIDLDDPFEYDRSNGNLVIVTGVTAQRSEPDIQYYNTVIGNGFDRDNIVALEIDDDSDASVIDPDSYKGDMPLRVRSERPNIKLGIDTSAGGQLSSYEVSFDTDGGQPVPDVQTITRGGKVSRPEDPVKDGYRFTGWFKGDREYDFNTRVTGSFTLKAGWKKLHMITFLGWNDEVMQSSEVEDGEKPEYEGETPTRPDEGDIEYVFAGWDPPVKEADSDQTYRAVFMDKSEIADKTELNAAIKAATDARTGVRTSEDGSDVGKNFKYVTEAEMQAYNDALEAAQEVADNAYATREQVDQAIVDLENAKTAFTEAQQNGKKEPPAITEIVISNNSGRQQPAVDGTYEWKVTFEEGTDLGALPESRKITDDDFQIQRKPSGAGWKNSKCPYASFSPSGKNGEENIGYLTGMAIPDNSKETDTTNLWRFIYSGDCVECPVITQDGYSKVDKTELRGAIDDAQAAKSDVRVSDDGWDVSPSELFVTPAEMQALDDALAAAKEVYSNARASQNQVDKAAGDLSTATAVFINAKKGGNGADEEAGYLQGDYRLVYETKKVRMADIPVREYEAGQNGSESYEWYTEKPLRFSFYDSTTQQNAGIFTTKAGTYTDEEGTHQTQLLSSVDLIRGHRYIVSVYENDYMIPAYYRVAIADDGAGNSDSYTANMANYYISLSANGKRPTDYKNKEELWYFDVMKRSAELSDPADARRVNIKIPVYYVLGTRTYAVSDVTVKLTNPFESLYATSDDYGEISVSLTEDTNYMVQLVDDYGVYALATFPLTIKDHAENGWPKSVYNHFSCGSVQGLYLIDKQNKHADDTKLVSASGKTSVTGQNFLNATETNADRYIINDRQLSNSTVSGLDGQDYEVFRVDAINMFRTELSRLAAGSYTITRKVPSGKTVESVCYLNKQGKLKTLKFTQKDGKVTFTMNSLSMYPNVIIYKSSEPEKTTPATVAKVRTVTINNKTVTAAAVKKAIKKAGGSSKVTKLVLGKKVRKISKGAFRGTKIKTIVVKSKKLKKKTVKGSLKGSKVTTIKVQLGTKKLNKQYVKKYKKIFTKKNAGKKVTVKR